MNADHTSVLANAGTALLLVASVVGPILNAVKIHRAGRGPHRGFHWFRVLHALALPLAVVFAQVATSWTTESDAGLEVAVFNTIIAIGLVGMVASSFPLLPWMTLLHLGTMALALLCWSLGMDVLTHWSD